jgi:hypothetical protein
MSRLTECGDKTQYKTKAAAREGIAKFRRSQLSIAQMNVYRCDWCQFWHFGHRRPGKPRHRR